MDKAAPPELPQAPPTAGTPFAKPRRPWALYTVIALLTMVVALQSMYIFLSRNATVQSVASAYGEVTSPEFLSELEDLLAMLNEPIGLNPNAPVKSPQQPAESTPPAIDPDAAPPKSPQASPRIQPAPKDEHGALGIDPNMSVNDLLNSVLALGGLFDDAYGMLEDEPIIPQAPNDHPQAQQPQVKVRPEQPAAPSGLTHQVHETAVGYRIEVALGHLRNFDVECVGDAVVISGQRIRAIERQPLRHKIPLAHAVASETMRVKLVGDTLIITVEKDRTGVMPTPKIKDIALTA